MNPSDKFLVKSIAEASSRIPCRPVRKAETITPEIIDSICKHYGSSKDLLDVRFVCMCVIAFPIFFFGISKLSVVTQKKIRHFIKRYCNDLDIKLVFSSFKIGNLLGLRSRVVYRFTCAGCNACYVG